MSNITIIPPVHPLPTVPIEQVLARDFFERQGVLCWKVSNAGAYQEIPDGTNGQCQPGELVNPITAVITVSYVG